MTTIAFKDGVLASDTQVTSNGFRVGFASKIWRVGRLLIGGAGSDCYTQKFRDWVRGGMEGDHPILKDIGNVFILRPDGEGVMWCDDGPFLIKEPFWALGSGEQIALGAMHRGATAAEAVETAIAFDTRSGGKVVALAL